MIKFLTACSLILIISSSFAQNNDGKKVELQFNQRVSFYSVNDRYELLMDTIYHADDGFRVYSGYDITIAGDENKYVILRYPNWKSRKQQLEQIENTQQKTLFMKMIKTLYKDGSIEKEAYNNLLDSLKTIELTEKKNNPIHVDIVGRNGLKLAILESDFVQLSLEDKIEDVYSLKWHHSTKLASGFMTVPFKLRPKRDTVSFNMTTDITLGAYIGVKKRISRKESKYIVLPVTLGLSYINVGNNETSNVNVEKNSSVVPGWTWSSGIIFDLKGFNLGFVLGQDFASGVGEDWLYNKQLWYSFAIGYSFLNNNDKP